LVRSDRVGELRRHPALWRPTPERVALRHQCHTLGSELGEERNRAQNRVSSMVSVSGSGIGGVDSGSGSLDRDGFSPFPPFQPFWRGISGTVWNGVALSWNGVGTVGCSATTWQERSERSERSDSDLF